MIEAVGPGVNGFRLGDRVTYTGSPLGAYSTERVMPVGSLFKLPVDIDSRDRRGDDHARPQRRLLAAQDQPVDEGGRHHPAPCRRRRRRPDRLAMGEAARPARHRHRLDRGQGRAGDGAWLRRDHLLPPRGRAPTRVTRTDRRRGRHHRLRHRRQGHVRRLAEVAEAARRAGRLRHRLRARSRRSTRCSWRSRDRSISRVPRWPTIIADPAERAELAEALFDHVASGPHQDRDQPALRRSRTRPRRTATSKQARRRARRSS